MDDLICRLRAFVADQIAAFPSPPRVAKLIDTLHLSGGQLTVGDLAGLHDVDPRTVHRDITSSTGLSPKQFAMIIQFHRALRLLRNSGLDPACAAAEAGYADQAHMTRIFRQLGGFTPAAMPDVTLAGMSF